jgi:hypothetical protein
VPRCPHSEGQAHNDGSPTSSRYKGEIGGFLWICRCSDRFRFDRARHVSRVVIVLDGATVDALLKWAQKLIDATCWMALPGPVSTCGRGALKGRPRSAPPRRRTSRPPVVGGPSAVCVSWDRLWS